MDSTSPGVRPDHLRNPRETLGHPVLQSMLERWRDVGFRKEFKRAPKPTDYICPNTLGKRRGDFRQEHASLESHTRHASLVGILPRRVHDMRHTFISIAWRSPGAQGDMVSLTTHGPSESMLDNYSHDLFEAQCRSVLCIRLGALEQTAPTPNAMVGTHHQPNLESSSKNTWF